MSKVKKRENDVFITILCYGKLKMFMNVYEKLSKIFTPLHESRKL